MYLTGSSTPVVQKNLWYGTFINITLLNFKTSKKKLREMFQFPAVPIEKN